MKQISTDIISKFFDELKKVQFLTHLNDDSYHINGSKMSWVQCGPGFGMLNLNTSEKFDFTVGYWYDKENISFIYGHEDDAFRDKQDREHEWFDCIHSSYRNREEQYFMDSTVTALALPYEVLDAICEFFHNTVKVLEIREST